MRRALDRLSPSVEISLAHDFHKPPYGGSNQFFIALRNELQSRGWDVGAYRLGPRTRGCILNSFAFDDLPVRHGRHRGCRIAHRVDGPVAAYRGVDDGTDARVALLNEELADVTIVQSEYSLEAHRQLGIFLRNPVVIRNAVDPGIFHPPASRPASLQRKMRLIATSWSDNPNKGGDVLEWIDRNLDWESYECTFVGRLDRPLERIRAIPPQPSYALAELLRASDAYIAPSWNDPCSNALLEALACGLPAVYRKSGGHPELVGGGGVAFSDPGEIPSALESLRSEYDAFRARIPACSLTEVADRYLLALGL